MATAPRRETLIALRARRTAYRVASDLLLFQRTKALTINCLRCRRSFVPMKGEKICPNCASLQPDPAASVYVVLPPTWRDRMRAALAPPTRSEWVMLIIVFTLLGASVWTLRYGLPGWIP
jgi:hypothetical protein